MNPHDDGADRRALTRDDLDHAYFVEAAAGTGKTRALVERALALIVSGRARMGQIALVTFSHEAAGQLQLRLREALDRARQASATPEPRLEAAIAEFEDAAIDTIHGFCGQILRARPIEAGVDPGFVTGSGGPALRRRILRRWFEAQLAAPSPGFARFLARYRSQPLFDDSPLDALDEVLGFLIERRDLDAPWPKPDEAASKARAAALAALAELTATLRQHPSDHPAQAKLSPLFDAERDLDELEGPEAETALAGLRDLCRQLGRPPAGLGRIGALADGLSMASVSDQVKRVFEAAETALALCDQELLSDLREELRGVAAAYTEASRRAGRLDFSDLLMVTRDLLLRCPDVLEELRRRFTVLMVDEFQDTDPVQAEIVELLAGGEAPSAGLTLVGDPKQSIYGFRRADLAMYEHTRSRLQARGVRQARLSVSHRSLAPIQAVVNRAFGKAFERDALGPDYLPLEGGPEPYADQPAVLALPVRHPFGEFGSVWKHAVRTSLEQDIPAFVRWLLTESDWTVRGEDGAPRPIEASDVCILFRKLGTRKDLYFEPIQRNLEAHRIETVLVGSRSLHQRDEIEALITAATSLEWPRDELAVYGTLRGPLFGFADGELLGFRTRHGSLNPYRAPTAPLEDADPEIRDALEGLRLLSTRRNRRPHAETLRALYAGPLTRGALGFAVSDQGRRALSNLELALEVARKQDGEGGSFRSTVEALRAAADEKRSRDGALNAKASPGVRLMTAHAAKGLEFPVVLLADPCEDAYAWVQQVEAPEAKLAATRVGKMRPRPLVEAEAAERAKAESEVLRLAYVAATRARDLLVVPTVPGRAREIAGRSRSWLAPLLEVLDSAEEATRFDPDRLPPAPPKTRFGMAELSWLEPGPAAEPNRAQHEAWVKQLDEARELGLGPSLALTRLDAAPPGAAPIPEPRNLAIPRSGPRDARRYGQLVHAVARDLPLEAEPPPDGGAGLVRFHARLLRANEAEVTDAIAVIARLLEDPLIARARAATRCWRAFPIVAHAEDGTVVDTVVDLLLQEPQGFTAVDLVTGSGRMEAAKAKMQHARAALETGGYGPVTACLLLKLD